MSIPRRLTAVPGLGKRDDDYAGRVTARAVMDGTQDVRVQAPAQRRADKDWTKVREAAWITSFAVGSGGDTCPPERPP